MLKLKNIHALSDFQRNAKMHLRRLEQTGLPEILTINGEAKLVVLDAESFQKILEKLDEADAVLGIRRGLASMERGQGMPVDAAFSKLDKKIYGKRRK
jgi:PHD/YefM family antitoxin component YafN of YafNO toxin-antitoxin module